MESKASTLLRKILQSPIFLSKTIEDQQAILNEILLTGEITREDLSRIISEEADKQKVKQENERLAQLLNSLDYNTFLTFILTGNIRGKKLITLCSSSKKLNEYCNRGFQLMNGQGISVGGLRDQYLFRLLLEKERIPIFPGRTPRKTYYDKIVGGDVWVYGDNYQGKLGLGKTVMDVFAPTINPRLMNIIQISMGYEHTLCLDSKGRVWSFGSGFSSELGSGDRNNKYLPSLITDFNNIIEISCGHSHSLCLDNQGKVWSFGRGDIGQLGSGDSYNSFFPALIKTLNNVVHVSGGGSFSLCLDDQGRVWSFGANNQSGQLGLGDNNNRLFPTIIPNLNQISKISAGSSHSLCLDNRGKVWSFGSNGNGQLGLGDRNDRNIPVLIPGLENIVEVSSGENHSHCLDNQGRVWVFGGNAFGQLGLYNKSVRELIPVLNPYLSNIIQICAVGLFSICLNDQGRVLVFGDNNHIQFDRGTIFFSDQPIVVEGLDNIMQICGTPRSLMFIRLHKLIF